MSGDLDEARDLLARWAAGGVTDPDVWGQRGRRLLAGLVAEVERLDGKLEDEESLHVRCDQGAARERRELEVRLLAAEGVIEAAREWAVWSTDAKTREGLKEELAVYDVDRAVRSVVTADQETPE